MRCEHSRTLWRRQPAGASRSSAVGYVWRSVDDHPLKLSSAFNIFFFCRKLLQGTLMLQLLNCVHLLAFSFERTSSRLISLAHSRRTGERVLIRRRWVHGPRSLDSASKRRTASHLRSYHRKPFSLSIHWILCVVTGEKTRRPLSIVSCFIQQWEPKNIENIRRMRVDITGHRSRMLSCQLFVPLYDTFAMSSGSSRFWF